jgi:hypothetical protein
MLGVPAGWRAFSTTSHIPDVLRALCRELPGAVYRRSASAPHFRQIEYAVARAAETGAKQEEIDRKAAELEKLVPARVSIRKMGDHLIQMAPGSDVVTITIDTLVELDGRPRLSPSAIKDWKGYRIPQGAPSGYKQWFEDAIATGDRGASKP